MSRDFSRKCPVNAVKGGKIFRKNAQSIDANCPSSQCRDTHSAVKDQDNEKPFSPSGAIFFFALGQDFCAVNFRHVASTQVEP